MTQPLGSGAPDPVQGVTGGPGLPQGVASVDGGTGNVIISPPSNTIEQKKTTVPQTLFVYERFISNADFVRIGLQTQTNGPEIIGVSVQPPGTLRDLVVGTTGNLRLNAGASDRWSISGTDGSLTPVVTGTQVIGSVAANVGNIITQRVTLFTSGGALASGLWSGSGVPLNATGNNGDIYFNALGGALTTIYQKRAGAYVGIV